jgi:hypothetical protein
MNKRERVKALWDLLTDSQEKLASKLARYNTHLLDAEEFREAGQFPSAGIRLRWADQSLTDAVALLRAQAMRALRTADELETI